MAKYVLFFDLFLGFRDGSRKEQIRNALQYSNTTLKDCKTTLKRCYRLFMFCGKPSKRRALPASHNTKPLIDKRTTIYKVFLSGLSEESLARPLLFCES